MQQIYLTFANEYKKAFSMLLKFIPFSFYSSLSSYLTLVDMITLFLKDTCLLQINPECPRISFKTTSKIAIPWDPYRYREFVFMHNAYLVRDLTEEGFGFLFLFI